MQWHMQFIDKWAVVTLVSDRKDDACKMPAGTKGCIVWDVAAMWLIKHVMHAGHWPKISMWHKFIFFCQEHDYVLLCIKRKHAIFHHFDYNTIATVIRLYDLQFTIWFW